ncbi:unnamed protein product [Cylicostephanus goldi]|uniref:Uncharacterized protein n=1 Tax=Cylicostephanus goldi TaxID=71465 RepID=A0A3P6S093_CYLGO|nr:unnamed protein product [Cylicostephanus goldi]
MVWMYSFFDKEIASGLYRIGDTVRFDNSKATRLLGMQFRDPTESFIEMGYSLIERGIVKKRSGYRGVPIKYQHLIQANEK